MGPLCTAFSSARHLQRRSTSSDMRDLCHEGRNWARNSRSIWPSIQASTISHALHAANLRHGTDGFTSPPKEGMLWIFSPEKSYSFFFICSYLVLHCSGIGLSMVVCIVSYCMLWIFPAGKIRRLRSGANPRSWVPDDSMLTTRPPRRSASG
jgi:hypothetical protein